MLLYVDAMGPFASAKAEIRKLVLELTGMTGLDAFTVADALDDAGLRGIDQSLLTAYRRKRWPSHIVRAERGVSRLNVGSMRAGRWYFVLHAIQLKFGAKYVGEAYLLWEPRFRTVNVKFRSSGKQTAPTDAFISEFLIKRFEFFRKVTGRRYRNVYFTDAAPLSDIDSDIMSEIQVKSGVELHYQRVSIPSGAPVDIECLTSPVTIKRDTKSVFTARAENLVYELADHYNCKKEPIWRLVERSRLSERQWKYVRHCELRDPFWPPPARRIANQQKCHCPRWSAL